QMKFLAQADMILPTSRQYLDTSPTLQRFHERCRVMPLGIDTAAFETCDPQLLAEVRARYGESYVLFVGRHRYYKGIEYLVRAAPHIRAKVVIAGDGPERKRCQALAQKAGGDVEFPGELTHEELKAHLHGCAVFAFPSIVRSEAFGLSLLEAHACGKPTVATKLGTGVEFVSLDGETGLNVPPHDPGALAAAVNRLLDDSELRRRLGEAALRRVKSEFEAERVARAEFDLYQEVLG
ncbi:MAG: glycosyltransferase, partial [Candidatus Hydrogenedentes bacterium]|nr:glycosyltransferase [Candidatus Hydrogenedentota bacterium]